MDELSERRAKRGIAADFLARIDGAEVAAAAAECFDRAVNPTKYWPRFRLLPFPRM